MIQVKVTLNKAWAAAYLGERGCGCELDGKLIMAAMEGDAFVGCGVISMEADSARVHEMCCDDSVGYIMGKALLNLIDNAGIETVYCDNAVLDALLVRLGFKPHGTGHKLSLEGYFTSHCGG